MRRPVKISSETASARSMPLARRNGFALRSARAASSSGKARSFRTFSGSSNCSSRSRLRRPMIRGSLRVEAAADQVDLLLRRGIDPNDSARATWRELAGDPERHRGARVAGGRHVRRQEVPQAFLEVAALEEDREAGDGIDRQDVPPHQRRGEAAEEDDVAR